MIGRTWQQLQEGNMKTEEDEAFDDLAKKQGDWGGGFKAKRAMAKARVEDDDDIQDYKKPWVSLTDEEIDKTYWRREPFRRPTQFEFARDIEQLLKEKNGV
jgi:hypothetical protein